MHMIVRSEMQPADAFLLLTISAVFARMAFGPNCYDLEYMGVSENDD